MKKRDSKMNHKDAQLAAVSARTTAEAVKCMTLFVHSAERKQKFLSCQRTTDQSIAANVSKTLDNFLSFG